MEIILKIVESPKFYLPILYICIGILAVGVLDRVMKKLFSLKLNKLPKTSVNYKKSETVRVLIQNIGKYVIFCLVILAILTAYGVNVMSILAGLGLVGVVIGLALQDILKDFFAGMSIILENQFAIGDNIEIDGFRGEVVFLGLKTTKIKSYQGSVKILANRNIIDVINYSMEPSLAIVDVSVSYEENLDKIEKVLTELAQELTSSLDKLKGEVELLGIRDLDDSAIIYRLTVPTVPLENFQIERKIRRAIKSRFDEKKIKIPYPQVEVHNGNK